MKVSVIIPTYNGAHKVVNVLAALEQQTRMPEEVLVVIDGSTDDTAAILRAKNYRLPSLQIIEQPNGGRAQVRNRGAAAAKGDLLVFFDDDMRPMPQCIAQHTAHHERFPGSILTGGLMEEITPASTDIQKFKSVLSRRWSAPLLPYDQTPMPAATAFLTAANCSMQATTWALLHGMDERLTDAEDYDMGVRAIQQGIDLYYNQQAFAWHDDFITCASYIRRLRQYAVAQQKLQQIKPELYGATHKFAIHRPTGPKAVFFKTFCRRSWISSIDKQAWTFLPETLRYKLYDWVITANGSFYPDKVKL